MKDAREAGANGFIMVDLPPEEAIRFREICAKEEFVARGFPLCRQQTDPSGIASPTCLWLHPPQP